MYFLIISSWLLKGDLTDKHFEGKNINALMTFALLGSKDFIEHYRTKMESELGGFYTTRFLITKNWLLLVL